MTAELRDKDGYYLIEGSKYISVTKVLSIYPKPWLVYWYGKEGTAKCQQIARESQEVGTALHNLKTRFFAGDKIKLSELGKPQVKTAYKSFQKWWKEKQERTTYTIYDFKVSDYKSIEYWLQLTAYGYGTPISPPKEGYNDEVTVYNKEYGYAGTADCIFVPKHNGTTTVGVAIVNLGKEEVGFTETYKPINSTYLNTFRTMISFYHNIKELEQLEKENKKR